MDSSDLIGTQSARTGLVPSGPRRSSARDRARNLARQLLYSKTFVVGAAILLFWIIDAIFWPLYLGSTPQDLNPATTLQGPSWSHWFGTDNLGRDVFARTLAGASSVLIIAPLATLLGVTGGVILGLLTGYFRGGVDVTLSRIVDAILAFPVLILSILVLTVLGTSTTTVIILIGVVFTPLVSRTVRAAVLGEREKEYVAAARLRGDSALYIMFAEILPNIRGPIAVEATVRLGYAIFLSATLSFLGFGVQEPSPDWGLTIALGRAYVGVAPWMVLFPVFALATLVVAVNLVVDGIKETLEDR